MNRERRERMYRWQRPRERDKKPYRILRGRKVWYRDLYVPWEPLDEEDV